MFWIGTMALTACMFVSPQRSVEGLASNPHAFFNKTENCTCCHDSQVKGTVIDHHAFSVDIIENCMSCHTSEMLGPQSHPVGVTSAARFPDMEISESLPLDADDRITCGTCHNPHLDGYSKERYASGQKTAGTRIENGVEVAYYKSFMLRLHAPDAGNDPTCAGCHADKF